MSNTVIKVNFDAYVEHLRTLVSIPSYLKNDGSKYPFGSSIQEVLETMLAICESYGFATYLDPEGHYGYADIGEGDSMFGVLCHLDVVDEGDINAWNFDPYTLTEVDGKLYGRGTSDDKGPTLSALFGLLSALDAGYTLDRKVRFIFGVDEESLWRCMRSYVSKETLPDFGIAPDSIFPLTYAEKGLIEFKIKSRSTTPLKLNGGGPLNAVPSLAKAPYSETLQASLEVLGYDFTVENQNIIVKGKAMHAKDADKGINAIVRLCEAIKRDDSSLNILNFVVNKLGNPNGFYLYGDVQDEISGKLKLNVGSISVEDGEQEVGVDIRFPVTYPVEEVRQILQMACAEYGLILEDYDYLPSIYIDKESDFIKSLMHAYQSVSGDYESQPISSGGATYARSMPNVVAFGGLMKDDPSVAHQANEHILIESTLKAIEIYAHTFIKLCMSKEVL